jgi:xylan 1,4-beta-xylosidase
VRQAAGLIAWYDRSAWIWLQLTWDAENGRHLRVVTRDRTTMRSEPYAIGPGPVGMRMSITGGDLRCSVTSADGAWRDLPGVYPAYALSDDHGGRLRFTGMFAGVRAEDLDRQGWSADFDYVDAVFTGA